MNQPASAPPSLASIVLTTLNSARFLHEALDSCLNQTYRNLELIVVDGGFSRLIRSTFRDALDQFEDGSWRRTSNYTLT